jgi:hypothetical protein
VPDPDFYWRPVTLSTAVRLLCILAAVLSVGVAWRRPSYRPVAVFLCVAAVRALLRGVLRFEMPDLALARIPASVPRAALLLDQALYLAWPAAIFALGLGVCFQRGHLPALAACGLALSIFVGFGCRSALAEDLYALLEVASLAFLGGAVIQWSGRDRVPGFAQAAVVLVLVSDGLAFVVTRGGASSGALWPSALSSYFVLYICLIILQGVALCRRLKLQ